MDSARPLDSFPLIHTSKLEELRASLASIYAKPALELTSRDKMLRAILNHCQLQHIGLSYASYGTDVRFQFPKSNFVAQLFPLRGKAEVVVDGVSAVADPDHSVLISANTTFDMKSNADYERLILTISSIGLGSKLTALIGESVHSPLKMSPSQTFTRPSARILRDHFMFFVSQLSAVTSLPSLVLAEFEQTLMMMFLYANQHNYSDLLEQKPSDIAAWQVRRAEEYIEANWDKPMKVEAIAAISEVSIRSLFRSFRQSRGYSPKEFVRQVRLRHARAVLQNPGPAATVADIAFACGFGDLGRFSIHYFQAFGELPSVTLDRARGAGLVRH
jgi:AraC-like DNA-binding protein